MTRTGHIEKCLRQIVSHELPTHINIGEGIMVN